MKMILFFIVIIILALTVEYLSFNKNNNIKENFTSSVDLYKSSKNLNEYKSKFKFGNIFFIIEILFSFIFLICIQDKYYIR